MLSWAISREEDRTTNKNSIDYQYQHVGWGEYLLTDIYYSGVGTTKGNRRVNFVYESRDDVSSKYIAGGLTRQTKRLDKLITYVASEEILEYNTHYKQSDASGRSLLESIELCGYEGTIHICQAPTLLTWQDAEPQFELEKVGYRENDSLVPMLQSKRHIVDVSPQGDANADGVLDWPTWQHDAEGEVRETGLVPLQTCEISFITHKPYCISGDFNGDGATDSWRSHNNVLQVSYEPGSWVSTGIPMNEGHYPKQIVANIDDYNRDGRPDIVIERGTDSSGDIYLYLHTGNDSAPFVNNGKHLYQYDGESNYRYTSIQFMGDMDGNGLPDFMEFTNDLPINNGSNLSRQPMPYRLHLAESSSPSQVTFNEVNLSLHANPDSGNGTYFFHYFIDINGDGLQDWVSWDNDADLLVSMNKGSGIFGGWRVIENSSGLIETRPFPYYHQSSSEWRRAVYAKYASNYRQMDLDADGRAEILVPGIRVAIGCHIESSFEQGSTVQSLTICGDGLYSKLLDPTNGGHPLEGKSIDVDNHDDSVYKYQAIRFSEDASGNISASLVATDLYGSATQTASFDGFGNGLQDLVFTYGCRTAGCSYHSTSGVMDGKSTGVYINRNRGSATEGERYAPIDVLVGVKSGFGVEHEWDYRPLSSRDDRYHTQDKPFYERGGYLNSLAEAVRADHLEFTSSMYVVAEHRQSNGIGGLNTKQYRYKGAVFNSRGRGFQGFHTIIEEDEAANIETQSDFHQIFPLAGKLHRQRKWELNDRDSDTDITQAFIDSDFSWQFWPAGGHGSPIVVEDLTDSSSVAANDPYFVGPKEQSTTYRTLNGARSFLYKQTQSSSFDEWGNILLATNRYEEVGSSHIVRSSTSTKYAPADETIWWLNKLEKQTVTKLPIQSRSGVAIEPNTDLQQQIEVSYESWDSDARKPTSVLTDPSTGKWSRVETSYSDYGLPEKVVTTAEGEENDEGVATSRFVETTEFSGDGYFPKTVKNALGHTVTTITNPKHGKPDSVSDVNGLTTNYEYDAFGRLITVSAPSALGLRLAPEANTAMEWCNASCVTAPGAVYKIVQQQAGTPTTLSYHDQFGRVIRTEVQAFDGTDWVVRKTEFNELGQVTFESVPYYASSPNSYGTRYEDYDTLGRVLGKTVDQTNSQILDVDYTHEQGTGFTTSILVNGRTMSRTYNGLQQLTETVDALSGSTKYAYDGAGNPIVLQDAATNRIIAKYNALGQKDWVNDPNMGVKSFTYNGFGEVETETDGNLDIVSLTYDRLGRMESRSVNGVEEANWVYDAVPNGKGLLSSEHRSDANYSRSYRYDALGRPDQVTTTIDGQDFVTVSHFDSSYGRLKGLSYPSGLTVQYGYNDAGYQFRTSNAASGYTYREITHMDAWGEWEFANVAADNYVIGRAFHAETGQMLGTAFDSLVLQHQMLSYDSYDSFGNLEQATVSVPSESPSMNVENHFYDALNRLDYTTRTDGPAIDYDYDAIGNLLKKDDFASSYEYTGGTTGGPSAVKSVTLVGGGTLSYGYDDNGNRTHEGGSQQVWYNAFNKPIRISRNGADLYFSYGADQMRYKQVNQAAGKTTIYIDKLFEHISGGGDTQYRHFIDDIAVVTTTDNGTDLTHKIGFTHRDRLGSTVAIGDESGNLLETHSFDPFGKPRLGNIMDKAVARLESTLTTRGFTDHEHLDDVELIHMNGRAYDYNLGRFLSVDPFIQEPGNSQSLNPYSYIMNNPLAGRDPSGYVACATTTCFDNWNKPWNDNWNQFSSGEDGPTERNKLNNGKGNSASGVNLGQTVASEISQISNRSDMPGQQGAIYEISVTGQSNNSSDGFGSGFAKGIFDLFASAAWYDSPNPFVELYPGELSPANLEGADYESPFEAPVSPEAQLGHDMALPASIVFGLVARSPAGIEKSAARVFDVGLHRELKGTLAGHDSHHVGQAALMRQFIDGYDRNSAPAILVPRVGHTRRDVERGIVSRSTTGLTNARQVLARDIRELRRVYSPPNSQLQKLIQMNKTMYPDPFRK